MDFEAIVFDTEAVHQEVGSVTFFESVEEALEYRDKVNAMRKPQYRTFIVRELTKPANEWNIKEQ